MQKISLRFFKALTFFLLLTDPLAFPAIAEDGIHIDYTKPDVPPDNRDLEKIQDFAKRLQSQKCVCPEINCDEAHRVLQNLADLQGYLEGMLSALQDANADSMAHFKSLAEQGKLTNEQLGKTIFALGVQEFLHNMGSALLDLASITSFFNEIAEDPSKLASKSPAQIIENLDNFYEAIKDYESAVTTLSSSLTGQKIEGPVGELTPNVLGFESGELNDFKSTLSDAVATLKEVQEKGGDVREAFKKPGGPAAAVGQIAGRYLKAYSASQIQERMEVIASLNRDLAASDIAQAQSFRALQKVQARRFMTEDTLEAVRTALRSFAACAEKAGCGSFSLVRPQLPNFDTTVSGTQGTVKKNWGAALRYYNEALSSLTPNSFPSIKERVPCDPTEKSVGFIPSAGRTDTRAKIGFDTPVWCNFGGGSTPIPTPDGGGTSAPPPTSGPGGGIGIPTDGGGTPTTPGGTPTIPGGPPTKPEGPGTTTPPTGTTPKPNGDDPRDGDDTPPTPPPVIVKASKTAIATGAQAVAVQGALLKIETPAPALPLAGNAAPDAGFNESPMQGVTGPDGQAKLGSSTLKSDTPREVNVDLSPQSSMMVTLGGNNPRAALHPDLHKYWTRSFLLDGQVVAVLFYPQEMGQTVARLIRESANVLHSEINYCREKEGVPNDPYLRSAQSWKQNYADQWGIQRVGFSADSDSAWNIFDTKKGTPVVVAVIDSGLDWNHKDFSWNNIWHNPGEIPDNDIDDDGNGYIDDVIGWDFFTGSKKPWDYDGHGTFVTGVIAATQNNGIGIAGINPNAKIMILKALNSFGHTRASFIAEAVLYAANHGAQVINLSVGGKNRTRAEERAIAYALSKGIVVVVAAGNEGVDVAEFGPASLEGVITVAATDPSNKRAMFSNWGAGVDIAAPGMDILSLRARRTDLMRDLPGTDYQPDSAFVGGDKRYFRASGTSFAAPIVAGTASLLLSKNPSLSAEQVKQILLHSAKDIETPGVDQLTGYGLLDARAALVADPNFFLVARIDRVAAAQRDGNTVVEVHGSLQGSSLARGWIEIGAGEAPTTWKKIGTDIRNAIERGALGSIPASELSGAKVWTIRVIGEDKNGIRREAWFRLNLG